MSLHLGAYFIFIFIPSHSIELFDTLHHFCPETKHPGDEHIDHSFEGALSNSLHGNIVLKSQASKALQKVGVPQATLWSHGLAHQLDTAPCAHIPLTIPAPLPMKHLIAGTVKKKAILHEYREKLARRDGKSIITQK